MSQHYMEANSLAERGHARVSSRASAVTAAVPASVRVHTPARVSRGRRATAVASAHDSKVRRFSVALWCSLLLTVAGVGLLFNSAGPDDALPLLLGGASIVVAAALLRWARATLIASFECELQKQGTSDGAVHFRARDLFDALWVSPKAPPSGTPEKGDPRERLLDKVPLA